MHDLKMEIEKKIDIEICLCVHTPIGRLGFFAFGSENYAVVFAFAFVHVDFN